jgi:hypothetical protein
MALQDSANDAANVNEDQNTKEGFSKIIVMVGYV